MKEEEAACSVWVGDSSSMTLSISLHSIYFLEAALEVKDLLLS